MLRTLLRRSIWPCSRGAKRAGLSSVSNPHASKADDDELRKAREWLANISAETIPENIGELSFSRSSGPGGQNVNKVNSKVTLRVPLQKLQAHIPAMFVGPLKASRYYKSTSDDVVIQSDDERKQSANIRASFAKLQAILEQIGGDCVPGETSDAQKKRVQQLVKRSNERRLSDKKLHSNKKASRRGTSGS